MTELDAQLPFIKVRKFELFWPRSDLLFAHFLLMRFFFFVEVRKPIWPSAGSPNVKKIASFSVMI